MIFDDEENEGEDEHDEEDKPAKELELAAILLFISFCTSFLVVYVEEAMLRKKMMMKFLNALYHPCYT